MSCHFHHWCSLAENFDESQTLIQSLKDPSRYPHPVSEVTVQETHISWVLLTGPFAYKIKKPVNLGFLDFSTLALRYQACLEELRLNGRLAPMLYLEVVPITGSPETPLLGGDGEPFEFAVKMREFPLDATLDHALPSGHVCPQHMDQLAEDVARFHMNLVPASETSPLGKPNLIREVVGEVFDHFSSESVSPADQDRLRFLKGWMEQEHATYSQHFTNRKDQGFIRECHGDLHLGNVVLVDDRAIPFDGIEFSERLRWIDVMSDVAFFVMDLIARGRSDFAWRFLNGYLEHTGDYDGLTVLRFYEVYRALVRAKVAHIRLNQTHQANSLSSVLAEEFHRYINVAHNIANPAQPHLLIMHGLSGSGKSTIAQSLLETLGAIRLRSDIERKRMFGLAATDRSAKDLKTELYRSDTTDALYRHLQDSAARLLTLGYSVIVDATCLKRKYREDFRGLAEERGVLCLILDVQASSEMLTKRIARRAALRTDPSEADLAVLKLQQQQQEPLGKDEQPLTFIVNSEEPFEPSTVLRRLQEASG